jgi:hypothetical protein
MPLLQFVEFFGIEPFYAAGIDLSGDSVFNYPNQKTEKCFCMLQRPWVQASHWSRDDLIGMLTYAEQVFYWETNLHPSTEQVENERIQYRLTNNLNRMRLKSGEYVAVRLQNSCGFQETGKIGLMYLGLAEVVKPVVSGALQQNFTVTFTVPVGMDKSRIKLYFTSADANYIVDPTFADREYEIRPLRGIVINGDTCTVTIPAYLLKKPSLDEQETCLPHAEETYVDEVLAFYTYVDECEQGYFVCNGTDCYGGNCDELAVPVCFQRRTIGQETWLVPKTSMCDDNGVMQRYCLQCTPKEVAVNYLSGIKPLYSGDVQYGVSQILSKLAIGLADCVRAWCDCDQCAEQKIKYYREVPRIAVLEASSSGKSYGSEYKELLTPQTIALLSGYPPYQGITMALREMSQYKCYNVEGSSL